MLVKTKKYSRFLLFYIFGKESFKCIRKDEHVINLFLNIYTEISH